MSCDLLPNGWKTNYVYNVADLNRYNIGKNYPHEKIWYIDVTSINNRKISKLTEIKLSEAPSRAKRIVMDDDILISTVRPNLKHFAKVKKAKCNLISSTGFAVISPKNINPDYLYYFLTTDKFTNYLTQIAEGHTSAYPSINPSVISNSKIMYPDSISEQQKIASILKSLDDKIELLYETNETLEQIAQALFKYWFIDFEFPDENGKPYRSSGGGMKPSSMGMIPDDWDADELNNYVDVIKGCSYKSTELQDSDTALVTLKSIKRGGGYKKEGLKPYTGKYKKEQLLESGDLVVACTDLTQTHDVLGKPAIVMNSSKHDTLIASLDLMIVRPKTNLVTIPYLYYTFKQPQYQHHTKGYANGTTVLHMNKNAIPDYVLPIPTDYVAKRFRDIIEPVFNKIDLHNEHIQSLTELRDLLLPRLMSGKIRVPVKEGDESCQA